MNVLLAATIDDGKQFIAEHPRHRDRRILTPRGFRGVEGRIVSTIVTTPAFEREMASGRGYARYARIMLLMCERSAIKSQHPARLPPTAPR